MAITIAVYRDAGDRPGDEINESLLGDSLPAALARGLAELDGHARVRRSVTLTCVYIPGVRLGDLVEVDDPTMGVAWRGQITGIAHADDGVSIITTLTVERQISG